MAELPLEALALLETIAGPESAGNYDIIYGGSRFDDFSDHPRRPILITSGPNKGKYSTAAGKFQFIQGTWDDQANKLGLTDFGPPSQNAAAWNLAQEEYKRDTGRDLLSDLQSGDLSRVAPSLRNQWTSMPGGIEQGITGDAFSRAYADALGSAGPQYRDVPLPGARPNTVPRTQLSYAANEGGTPLGLPPIGPTGGPALGAIMQATAKGPPQPTSKGFWSQFTDPVKTAMGNIGAPVVQAATSPNVQRAAIGPLMGSLAGRTMLVRSLMGQNIGQAPTVSQGHSGPGTRAMAVTGQGATPVMLASRQSSQSHPSSSASPNSHMNMDVYRANAAVLGGGGFNQSNIDRALSSGKTLYKLA